MLRIESLQNNFKVYFLGSSVRTICLFIIGIMVAKLLGPAERGLIGVVMSIAMLSSIAGSIGLPQLASINSQEFLRFHSRLVKSAFIALILSCGISVFFSLGLWKPIWNRSNCVNNHLFC